MAPVLFRHDGKHKGPDILKSRSPGISISRASNTFMVMAPLLSLTQPLYPAKRLRFLERLIAWFLVQYGRECL